MPLAADLYALQEIDSALDAVRAEQATITERSSAEGAITPLRTTADQAEGRRTVADQAMREVSAELADLQEHITPVEAKLYGGEIRAPKELQSLQEDLDMLSRRRSGIEERQLTAMEEIEQATANLTAARQQLQEAESTRVGEVAGLSRRQEELDAEMGRLAERRSAIERRIPADSLALYNRLRSMKRGRAVARIERGVCLGCRITLPTIVQQRARSASGLARCSSCDRILFAG